MRPVCQFPPCTGDEEAYSGLEFHLNSTDTSQLSFLLTTASGEETKVPPRSELSLVPTLPSFQVDLRNQASYPEWHG
jgi:hypothetical protein